MIKLDIETNARDVASGIDRLPEAMSEGIAQAMNAQNQLLVGYIQSNKLSSRGANSVGVVTGSLRQSVYATPATAGASEVTSQIGTPVLYGLFLEEGTRSYTIVPRSARVLSWIGSGGSRVFAGKVQHPGLPARKMFRSAIEEKSDDYQRAVIEAADKAWDSIWAKV